LATAIRVVRKSIATLFVGLALLTLALGSLWVSFLFISAEGPDDDTTEWSVWFFWPITLVLAVVLGTIGLASAKRLNEIGRLTIGAVVSLIAVILVSVLRLPTVANAGLEIPTVLGTDVAALILTARLLPNGNERRSPATTFT
jgi:hypothetical protein